MKDGVILSALLVGTQLLSSFIQQHVQLQQVIMGVRSSNSLIGLIY